MRKVENLGINHLTVEELSNQQCFDTNGGFLLEGLAVLGGLAALAALEQWGYDYARSYGVRKK